MLGIIIEHINFQVSPGQPSSISDDEGVTLVGSGQDAANMINQKKIHWGIFPLLLSSPVLLLPYPRSRNYCSPDKRAIDPGYMP
ncbi:transcription initiation factor TFIID subunit 5-like [Camellia sinensis]|uniref:transcription initiation factor TFIID subunit 5-like n=1 Tax=Camellia sinensis TaxID=4442 RepID=UPI001036E169|nr:transcription initiation factor TFIID subunit 5-like [Camellia sinensis]